MHMRVAAEMLDDDGACADHHAQRRQFIAAFVGRLGGMRPKMNDQHVDERARRRAEHG